MDFISLPLEGGGPLAVEGVASFSREVAFSQENDGGSFAYPFFFFNTSLSITMVTGPSFTSDTFISAPNIPHPT